VFGKEASMIGVFVTFRYQGDFDSEKMRKIAEMSRSRFEKMPGLRSKAFTLNPEAREAINFYVWDSEEPAKAFFKEELVERVTALYGVRPSIAFVEIATLVDNAATQ
jgi:heme-degrading monooxygenase HmoA